MNKTYGVCLGLLALGLVGFGAPASRAASRLAADESAGGGETATTSTTNSSASASTSGPADLRQPTDATKSELADLDKSAASAADGPQDQGSPAPAAQAPAAAPAAAAPMPLPTPSMAGPLATGIPHELPAGPFGKIEITGILSGIGLFNNNPVVHGDEGHVDISNAQIFIQKTTGVVSVLPARWRLQCTDTRSAVREDRPNDHWAVRPVPRGLRKVGERQFQHRDRGIADAGRGRVHVHLREHEHRARPSLESGAGRQPRHSAE